MNVIVTAEVTYELTNVENFDEVISIFQTCVMSVRNMEGVSYIGTKQLFATEMTDEGTFMESPQIWEMEEVQ
jgi:hypothetical protein